MFYLAANANVLVLTFEPHVLEELGLKGLRIVEEPSMEMARFDPGGSVMQHEKQFDLQVNGHRVRVSARHAEQFLVALRSQPGKPLMVPNFPYLFAMSSYTASLLEKQLLDVWDEVVASAKQETERYMLGIRQVAQTGKYYVPETKDEVLQ